MLMTGSFKFNGFIYRKFDKFTSELHPIPVRADVWHTLEVDLIGPLPETAMGKSTS